MGPTRDWIPSHSHPMRDCACRINKLKVRWTAGAGRGEGRAEEACREFKTGRATRLLVKIPPSGLFPVHRIKSHSSTCQTFFFFPPAGLVVFLVEKSPIYLSNYHKSPIFNFNCKTEYERSSNNQKWANLTLCGFKGGSVFKI